MRAQFCALLAGGAALDREIDAVLASFSDKPFIFNLGHGILPETPIAHVEWMITRVCALPSVTGSAGGMPAIP